LKDKKTLRDKRPKLGKLLEDEANEKVKERDVIFNDSENEDEDGSDLAGLGRREGGAAVEDEHEVQFTDEGTTAMFGGEVSVTVDSNIAEQLDEAAHMFGGQSVSQVMSCDVM
jgi:hypothetical protein